MATSPGGFYPQNPNLGQTLQGAEGARIVDRGFLATLELSAAEAATASTTAVHAAIVDTGVQQVVTTGITNPPYPRNITATSGGTATDIKAIQVTIAGTNELGAVITEVLPVFTENSATTVVGAKAFKTVTSITVPAHDGVLATTAVGFGDIIGLPHMLPTNTVLLASLNGVREGTAPTVVADADEIEKNTVDLNSALNGTAVRIYYVA
jgi:hypothetical protein